MLIMSIVFLILDKIIIKYYLVFLMWSFLFVIMVLEYFWSIFVLKLCGKMMFFVRILFFSVVLKICLLYILVIVLFIVVNYYVNCFIDFDGCGNFLG